MTGSAGVDAYLAALPPDARASLTEVRRITKEIAPEAEELIGYGIPGFKYQGRPLLYYAAAKNHCALYGLNTERAQQAGYDTSQKGTIRFPPDAPPPEALLHELLSLRLEGIEAEVAKRKKPSTKAKAKG